MATVVTGLTVKKGDRVQVYQWRLGQWFTVTALTREHAVSDVWTFEYERGKLPSPGYAIWNDAEQRWDDGEF